MTLAPSDLIVTEPQALQEHFVDMAERMNGLLAEAMDVLGLKADDIASMRLNVSASASVFHDAEGIVQQSPSYTWKEVAREGWRVSVTLFCEHDAECPSRRPEEQAA